MSRAQMFQSILLRAVALPLGIAVWTCVTLMGLAEWSATGTGLASIVVSSDNCGID